MLDRFSVGGFKSYEAQQNLPLAPLTLLIGTNASGKSNLIEALRLLVWLAQSHRLSDLAHAMREGELPIRGRVHDLFHGSDGVVRLGCWVDDVVLKLDLGEDGAGLRILYEGLDALESTSKLPYYEVVNPADEHGSELVVAYNNFKKGRIKPQITCIDQQAVFTQLLTPARFDAAHVEAQERIPAACKRIATALGNVIVLDPAPSSMRTYSYLDEVRLAPNGANVSAVLKQLCDAGRGGEVLEFVRALPEQDIRRLEFLQGPRNDVMLQLVETFGGREEAVDAAMLSDGTLRVLAVAAAVLSVEVGSLVVIEEIDNGVHPSRAKLLLEALDRVARARGIHLLLTTHNPALLDAVPMAALGDTTACYRDPETGASRLVRLADLDDFVALTARGPLGMLATSGQLEKFLKSKRSAEDRAQQIQGTLELFRS